MTMLPHFYRTCCPWFAWFDYQDLYADVVRQLPDGAHVVEVGCFLGVSTAFLAVEIANSGKRIRFDAVDTWAGSPEQKVLVPYYRDHDVYAEFMSNMRRGGVAHIVNPVRLPSVEAARLYADGSLDFCFIDAAHDYESVRDDLAAWEPKVKPGGVLAGHDWNQWPGVNQAVTERWGEGIEERGKCWVRRHDFPGKQMPQAAGGTQSHSAGSCLLSGTAIGPAHSP